MKRVLGTGFKSPWLAGDRPAPGSWVGVVVGHSRLGLHHQGGRRRVLKRVLGTGCISGWPLTGHRRDHRSRASLNCGCLVLLWRASNGRDRGFDRDVCREEGKGVNCVVKPRVRLAAADDCFRVDGIGNDQGSGGPWTTDPDRSPPGANRAVAAQEAGLSALPCPVPRPPTPGSPTRPRRRWRCWPPQAACACAG